MKRKQIWAVKRQIFLVSLTDMFFILLLFYLLVKIGPGKTGVASVGTEIKTPITGIGEINVLIQIMETGNGGNFLWLDNSAIAVYAGDPVGFESRHMVDREGLRQNIRRLKEQQISGKSRWCHVLVRCPNRFEYRDIFAVMTMLDPKLDSAKVEAARDSVDNIFAGKLRLSVLGYPGNGELLFQRGSDDEKGDYLRIGFGG